MDRYITEPELNLLKPMEAGFTSRRLRMTNNKILMNI